jgi:hypothetical protein
MLNSMAEEMPSSDPFAAARGNLRDTIKWLIAALAGLAAAVLGGSPLTSFGTLSPGWRFYLAVDTGLIGLTLIFIAIYVAFQLLVWKPFFLSDLVSDKELSQFIEQHATDLLPAEIPHLGDFLKARTNARNVLQNTAQTPDDPTRADASRFISESDPYVERLLSLAYFEYLRLSLLRSGRVLFALALGAVVFLGAFAWAANPAGKANESARAASAEQ